MAINNDPHLGQLVEINSYSKKKVVKRGVVKANGVEYDEVITSRWERQPFSGIGVYMGYRHVYDKCYTAIVNNGLLHDQYDEVEIITQRSEPIKLYLVVVNERKQPYYVHPYDINWLCNEVLI